MKRIASFLTSWLIMLIVWHLLGGIALNAFKSLQYNHIILCVLLTLITFIISFGAFIMYFGAGLMKVYQYWDETNIFTENENDSK